MELVAAGVWERRVGGYRVAAAEPMGRVIEQGRQSDSIVHLCEGTGSRAPSGSTISQGSSAATVDFRWMAGTRRRRFFAGDGDTAHGRGTVSCAASAPLSSSRRR
jgi:hypothetical protein